MGLHYEAREVAVYLMEHDGWRYDGSVDVRAAMDDLDTLPLISVDGAIMSYPQAMRKLKGMRHGKD